jgi:hypothetical protein
MYFNNTNNLVVLMCTREGADGLMVFASDLWEISGTGIQAQASGLRTYDDAQGKLAMPGARGRN